jgi:hypothetical protein
MLTPKKISDVITGENKSFQPKVTLGIVGRPILVEKRENI